MTPNALMLSSALAGKDALSGEGDERLVELAQAGSTGAFEQLVERHRRPLLAYCRKYLSPERAEDVVQLTFMRAYERIDQFQGESALRAWLYRVAHNSAIDALRDHGSRYSQIDESIDGVERPDQAFETRERMRDTVTAIKALPENQRDAVVLREFEGRSYSEISDQLGVTPGATRQLLARARIALRTGLAAVLPVGLVPRHTSLGNRFAELANGAGASASTMATQIGIGAVVTAGALTGAMSAGVLPGGQHEPGNPPTGITAGSPADLSRLAGLPPAGALNGKPAEAAPSRPASSPTPPVRAVGDGPVVDPRTPAAPHAPTSVSPPATLHRVTQPSVGPVNMFTVPKTPPGAGSEGQTTAPPVPVEAPPPAPNTEGQPAPEACQPQSACTPRGDPASPDPAPTVTVPGTEGQLPAPAGGTSE